MIFTSRYQVLRLVFECLQQKNHSRTLHSNSITIFFSVLSQIYRLVEKTRVAEGQEFPRGSAGKHSQLIRKTPDFLPFLLVSTKECEISQIITISRRLHFPTIKFQIFCVV